MASRRVPRPPPWGLPVILVPAAGTIPAVVMAELQRLAPTRIYLTGSTRAVSAGVEASLGTVAPVTRLFGADRYATAAAISTTIFRTVLGKTSVPVAYVAVGTLFPDALTGGPAAAMQHGPLLLVPPTGTLPASVTDALKALKPASIVVVGGTASVSAAVMAQLTHYAGTVTRVSGADRYLTAVAISKYAFGPGVPAVYLATGTNFPDAMGGAAAAGHLHGPVLLVGPTFYESPTLAEVQRLLPDAMYVLGGEPAIDDGVVDAFSPAIAP